MRKIFTIGIIFLFFLSVSQANASYRVSANAVIFSNSTKVKRYYGKNVHRRVRAASTIKVMTALLVLEHLSLDKSVRVSYKATLPQPSKIHVKVGEQYKVRDLLDALLIESANDAAVVLAEAVAGSESKFVQMMNARAKELGAKRTKFINANGLPMGKSTQYSTAYDMFLIFNEALTHPFFREAIKKKSMVIYSSQGRKIVLDTHNQGLFKGWKRNIYGKTGWTVRAKQCFVGYVMKGNDICVISLYGATNRWEDIRYIISRYGGIPL